ncbi:hypothetical protein PG999_011855 [Apiospora kogelbergensis]|uniref:Uncharacterized protein n=1 Tax=Apiospora kogelbergensis TaxID=1337665 RepID=A0AAW0QPX2_9PEZI
MASHQTTDSGGNSKSQDASASSSQPQSGPAQKFESFLAPAPKKPNPLVRLLCGSDDKHHEDKFIVSPRDVPQARPTDPSQPSATARRTARLAGEPDRPYRTRTGYNADTGSTYYSPR